MNCKYQEKIFTELEKNPGDLEQNLPADIQQHLQRCFHCRDFINSYKHTTKIFRTARALKFNPPKFVIIPTETKSSPVWSVQRAVISMAVTLILLILPVTLFYSSRKPGLAKVTFQINLPDASSVAIAGDFNNWDVQEGQLYHHKKYWTRTFTVRPGRYQYIVVVNGKKILPASSPLNSVADGFGNQNAVLNIKQNKVVLKI